LIGSLLILLQSAAVPAAQASPPQGAPPAASCQASELGRADQSRASGGAVLYVGCGHSAVRIGKVESYRSSYNVALGTLAVVVRETGRTRVIVARPAADGTVEIQDVSRDLGKLAGQPFNVELRGLEVDLGQFAADGTIAAPPPGRAASSARLTPDQYVPPAAERRQAAPETPVEGAPQ
jgi:hypothetical protein